MRRKNGEYPRNSVRTDKHKESSKEGTNIFLEQHKRNRNRKNEREQRKEDEKKI